MLIGRKQIILAFLLVLLCMGLVSCEKIIVSNTNERKEASTSYVSQNLLNRLSDDFEARDDAWKVYSGDWQFVDGVLKQISVGDRFPVILHEEKTYSDLDLSIIFKPISGRIDASGGLIFRAKDENNYYIVRANALENNFRLYKFIDGRRLQLVSAKVTPPELNIFHTMRVVVKGNKIQAYLNGKLELDYEDSTFDSGYIGLWTKADSVTVFDDLELKLFE